jgi:predicted DNA-binding protein
MLSVRLPEELERKVKQIAIAERRTKTEIVRAALEVYVESKGKVRSSYDLGKNVFGRHGSGRGDLSVSYKSKVKERIRAKYTH